MNSKCINLISCMIYSYKTFSFLCVQTLLIVDTVELFHYGHFKGRGNCWMSKKAGRQREMRNYFSKDE